MKKDSLLIVLTVLISLVSIDSASAARISSHPAPPGLASGAPPPAHADRDNNGLSDALQARLAQLPPQELVDVVVTFRGPPDINGAQTAVGPFRVKRPFHIVPGASATMTAAQARALANVPGVFRVEEDFVVTTQLDAARNDYGIDMVQGALSLDGSGVGICVVDTGIDADHEQFQGPGKVAGWKDLVNGLTAPYDDHGHGTHVAAIAAGGGGDGLAGRFRGVAPGASIYAAKVLNSAGSGSQSAIIAGIEWCTYANPSAPNPTVRTDVQIISMSLGTALGSDGTDALSLASNSAVAEGKVVVAAAGNSGALSGKVGSPGAAADIVTVGASSEWSVPQATEKPSYGVSLAVFSSRGPTLDGRIKPDIIAPGVHTTAAYATCGAQKCTLGQSAPIPSIFADYVTLSGTSMATPFVSGTIALYLQVAGGASSPAVVKQDLMATAQDRGPAGVDNDWGAGLLDGYAFVSMALGNGAARTAFPTMQQWIGQNVNNSNEPWQVTFDGGADQQDVPVAVTINTDAICTFKLLGQCLILEVPYLDVTLRDASGNVAAASTFSDACSLDTTGCGAAVLALHPTTQSQYTLEVTTHGTDAGGTFDAIVSIGPLDGAAPSPTPDNQLPTADFSYAVSDLSVDFTDLSSDGDGSVVSWSWDFGDGGTSLAQSPNHVYTAEGTYTVVLVVTDNDGAMDSASREVTVTAAPPPPPPPENQLPTADFSYVVTNLSVDFTDMSSDADGSVVGWSWNFGDGQTSLFQSPSHVYAAAGTYSVELTVTDNDGATNAVIKGVTTTAVPSPSGTMHVGDLDGSAPFVLGKTWVARVTVTVHDGSEGPVAGATVVFDKGQCSTDAGGQCYVETETRARKANFTVSDILHPTLTYDSSANHEAAGENDSDGSKITVNKP